MLKGIIFDFGGVFTKTQRRDRILQRCEDELGLARDALKELLCLFCLTPFNTTPLLTKN